MWFRGFLLAGACFAWVVFGWLATHRSDQPTFLDRYSPDYALILIASLLVAVLLTMAQFRPVYPRLHVRRGSIGLTLFSIVLPIVVVEVIVRGTDMLGVSHYEETRRYHLEKIADADLVFKHRPGLRTTYQGVPVTTNLLGLRNPEIGSKSSDEFRVLLLGDSVTFGWGVREEDTFGRRLEEINRQRNTRARFQAINTGVGGYNTEQEAAFLRRHGDTLKPDLVMLVYTVNDDEINVGPFDPWTSVSLAEKSPPELAKLLLWHSWTYRLFKHLFVYGHEQAGPANFNQAPGWKRSMNALAGIADYCRERKIGFAVVLYRLAPTPKTNTMQADLAALAQTKRYAFADSASWFRGRDPKTLINSVVDSHPNPAGHQLLAENIYAFLEANRLLPLPIVTAKK